MLSAFGFFPPQLLHSFYQLLSACLFSVNFNNLQVDQQLNIGHVHSFNSACVFECLHALVSAVRLLPWSKRGAAHFTARKTTQTLAKRIFVKLPILKIGKKQV